MTATRNLRPGDRVMVLPGAMEWERHYGTVVGVIEKPDRWVMVRIEGRDGVVPYYERHLALQPPLPGMEGEVLATAEPDEAIHTAGMRPTRFATPLGAGGRDLRSFTEKQLVGEVKRISRVVDILLNRQASLEQRLEALETLLLVTASRVDKAQDAPVSENKAPLSDETAEKVSKETHRKEALNDRGNLQPVSQNPFPRES